MQNVCNQKQKKNTENRVCVPPANLGGGGAGGGVPWSSWATPPPGWRRPRLKIPSGQGKLRTGGRRERQWGYGGAGGQPEGGTEVTWGQTSAQRVPKQEERHKKKNLAVSAKKPTKGFFIVYIIFKTFIFLLIAGKNFF